MILVVDDDAVCRLAFAKSLRAYGYDVVEAVDGAEAIECLEQHHPSIELVVTDMALPKVNGFNLVRNVQSRWPRIPVIMVSGYLSQETGQAIVGPHVDVLQKPFRPSALVALVQRMAPHRKDS